MNNDNNASQHNGHLRPEQNQQPGTNGRSPAGNLLSNYKNVQPNDQPPYPESQPGTFGPPFASDPMPRSSHPSTGQGPRPFGSHRLVANTMNTVRSWSDKMATVAGQPPEPPAPPLQRYRPSRPNLPPISQKSPTWKRSRTVRVMMHMRQRRERWERSRPKAGKIWAGVFIVFALLVLISSFGGAAYGYSYYQSQLPHLQQIAHAAIPQTTRIYDRNGVLLKSVFDKARTTPITYNDVPQVMQDAMIAAEDTTFWTNNGVDPIGIVRAGLSYFQHGGVAGGGSTITQQVVKNLQGNGTDVSLNRKLPEAALAIGLTQQYPKWKILEMYFNVAGFGNEDQGVEAAVEEFFGLKPVCDQNFKCTPAITQLDLDQNGQHNPLLGLARASLLAGIPQNPPSYDPTKGSEFKQRALDRQKYVLDQMVSLGMTVGGKPITPKIEQQVEAMTAAMTFTPFKQDQRAPHFVDWIVNQMETILGNGDPVKGVQVFRTAGLNIRTTIDANLEDYVEAAVKRHLTQPEYDKIFRVIRTLNTDEDVNDAAVVVMNAHTGEILAMDGSSDYNNPDIRVGGYYNVAADGTGRPVGSTYKPFVYATAFEMGWYPGIIVRDNKTYFPNGLPAGVSKDDKRIFVPSEFGGDNVYHDDPLHQNMPVRTGIAASLNVSAVKAMEFAGPDNVRTTVQRLGLLGNSQQDIESTSGIAWALGSNNNTLLQMTDAYQTFANEGQRVPPQGILDIWDNYGHNLYHYDPTHPPSGKVFSQQVAALITSILIDEPSRALEFSGDNDLSFTDVDISCASVSPCAHQVAAKTGTTNDFKDILTMGYTPDAVVGVWAGNANDESMHTVLGITGATPIWHSVISLVAGHCRPDPSLPCPTNVTAQSMGIQQHDTFPSPQTYGLVQAPTSQVNGLAPVGATNYDWMINGEQPQQYGIPPANNNNNNDHNGNNNGDNNGGDNNGNNNNGQ